METEKLSESFLKTQVFSKFGEFFVSTIYRRSSAALAPDSWYYETFGWSGKKIIADNSGAGSAKGAVEQHAEVCRQLVESGVFREKESAHN